MNCRDQNNVTNMSIWKIILLSVMVIVPVTAAPTIHIKLAYAELNVMNPVVNKTSIATHNTTTTLVEHGASKILPGQYLLLLKNTPSTTSNQTAAARQHLQPSPSLSSLSANLTRKGVAVFQKYNTLNGLAIQIPNQTKELKVLPHLALSSLSHVIPALSNPTHLVIKNTTLGDVAKVFVPKAVRSNLTLSGTKINSTNIQAKNTTQVCDVILKNPTIKACEPNRTVSLQSLHFIPSNLLRVGGYHNSSTTEMDLASYPFGVGIMDSGVNPHPDLNLFKSISFIGRGDLLDHCDHGTHVAGIVGAKDNSFGGIVGIAPDIKLWSLKIKDCTGKDALDGDLSTILAAINYITANSDKIKVVNLSFGYKGVGSDSGLALDPAINQSIAAGVTYVVAAGNGDETNHIPLDVSQWWPANVPGVIVVGAIADSDGKCGGHGPYMQVVFQSGGTLNQTDDSYAGFSNYGTNVTLAAPGVLINSTGNDTHYFRDSGTSEASPFVAGAAVDYLVAHPSASPSEVQKYLVGSASKHGIRCDGDARGYFTGDPKNNGIPLLYVKNMHPPR